MGAENRETKTMPELLAEVAAGEATTGEGDKVKSLFQIDTYPSGATRYCMALTDLDYFAGQALIARGGSWNDPRNAAEYAYGIAEAMLAERERRQAEAVPVKSM